MSTLFENSGLSIDPEKDYTADLIGEGKKYATLKDAARALVEKDVFIDRLKTEKKEVLEDLSKRMTMEEAISKLRETDIRNTPDAAAEAAKAGSDQTVDVTTINKLIQDSVKQQIQEGTRESRAEQNVELVKQSLTKAWGVNYPALLKEKAVELGVTEEWVTNAARTTPTVLLKLVAGDEVKDSLSVFNPTAAGINSAALSGNKSNVPPEGRYAYWQKMRLENPTQYHSPASSLQRHQAAIKYGEAFYDK